LVTTFKIKNILFKQNKKIHSKRKIAETTGVVEGKLENMDFICIKYNSRRGNNTDKLHVNAKLNFAER
jgi:hypothetical protein